MRQSAIGKAGERTGGLREGQIEEGATSSVRQPLPRRGGLADLPTGGRIYLEQRQSPDGGHICLHQHGVARLHQQLGSSERRHLTSHICVADRGVGGSDILDLHLGESDGETQPVLHGTEVSSCRRYRVNRQVDTTDGGPRGFDRSHRQAAQIEGRPGGPQVRDPDLEAVDEGVGGSHLEDATGGSLDDDGGTVEVAVGVVTRRPDGIGAGEGDLNTESIEVHDRAGPGGDHRSIKRGPGIQRLRHQAVAQCEATITGAVDEGEGTGADRRYTDSEYSGCGAGGDRRGAGAADCITVPLQQVATIIGRRRGDPVDLRHELTELGRDGFAVPVVDRTVR